MSYSGPVVVEVRVTVDPRQWGYELQWAYGNLVSPLPQAHLTHNPTAADPLYKLLQQVPVVGIQITVG